MTEVSASSTTIQNSTRPLRTGTHQYGRHAQQEDPLGPLDQSHLAIQPQSFRTGPRVRDQEGRHDGDHADNDPEFAEGHGSGRRQQVEHRDTHERGAVTHPVEGRVVERPELGYLPVGPGDRAVQGVHDPADQVQDSPQPDRSCPVGHSGGDDEQRSDRRDRVGADPRPNQPLDHGAGQGPERLLDPFGDESQGQRVLGARDRGSERPLGPRGKPAAKLISGTVWWKDGGADDGDRVYSGYIRYGRRRSRNRSRSSCHWAARAANCPPSTHVRGAGSPPYNRVICASEVGQSRLAAPLLPD